MDEVRIGLVSSVNGAYIKVTYPDRGGTVTGEMPLIGNGVYRIPQIGELIAVLHMSNGESAGFCLGGLAATGADYALPTLLGRLNSIEARIKALEDKNVIIEADISSLDSRVSALGG